MRTARIALVSCLAIASLQRDAANAQPAGGAEQRLPIDAGGRDAAQLANMYSYYGTGYDTNYDDDWFYDSYDYNRGPYAGYFSTYNYDNYERGARRFKSPQLRQARGIVVQAKSVGVQGTGIRNGVARVRTFERDGWLLVDLGSVRALSALEIRRGDPIWVEGPVVNVRGRRLLVATRLQHDDRTVSIDRSAQVHDFIEARQQSQTRKRARAPARH